MQTFRLQLSSEDGDLRQYRFHISSGYAKLTNESQFGERFIHKVIANRLGFVGEIDHIDQNTLNCKRDNLRPCTHSQNGANRRKFMFGYSQFKGVSWHVGHQKWVAQIRVNRKLKNLGHFTDELQAAKKYNQAAIMYFGEFASLNEV